MPIVFILAGLGLGGYYFWKKKQDADKETTFLPPGTPDDGTTQLVQTAAGLRRVRRDASGAAVRVHGETRGRARRVG